MNSEVRSGGADVVCKKTKTSHKEKGACCQYTVDEARKCNLAYLERFYFVIDSNSCKSIHGRRLYGYALHEGHLFINCDLPDGYELPLGAVGSYVLVEAGAKQIRISQDYLGTVGLYLYQGGDGCFALSNSFLHLLDYLKDKYYLHLNRDYAKYFLAGDIASWVLDETPVQEIKCLRRESAVEIDLSGLPHLSVVKAFSLSEIHSVRLDSEAGLQLLDAWRDRWAGWFRFMSDSDESVSIDITGGFDSRVNVALLLSSGTDPNKFRMHSLDNGLHTHAEDYEIASAIAKHYGFTLNAKLPVCGSTKLPQELVLAHSLLLKLGFHKHLCCPENYRERPLFTVTGSGAVRGYGAASRDKMLNNMRIVQFQTLQCQSSSMKLMEQAYNEMRSVYGHLPDFDNYAFDYVYMETRGRNHFGKQIWELLLGNEIILSPMFDREIYKISASNHRVQEDWKLIYAVILDRYAPGLLDFKYDGGRSFNSEAVDWAKALNARYPFREEDTKPTCLRIECGNVPDELALQMQSDLEGGKDARAFLQDIFEDKVNQALFSKMFGMEPLVRAKHHKEHTKYFPEELEMPAVSLALVLRCLDNAGRASCLSALSLEQSSHSSECAWDDESFYGYDVSMHWRDALRYLRQCRIDMKNIGSGNYLEVDSTDAGRPVELYCPRWFAGADGQGTVVIGEYDEIHLSLRCRGNGILKINCRGLDMRDRQGQNIPLWLTYTSLKINSREILSAPADVWHDRPYAVEMAVRDGEQITIDVAWLPYHYEAASFMEIIGRLYGLR